VALCDAASTDSVIRASLTVTVNMRPVYREYRLLYSRYTDSSAVAEIGIRKCNP
jgi:hypothetical protein